MSTLQLQDIDDYDQLTGKQVKAFMTMCGGLEVVKGTLMSELKITVEAVIRRLFDKNGRCRPDMDKAVVTAAVCDPNLTYRHDRLADDFDSAQMLNLWCKAFQQNVLISETDYKARIAALVEQIKSDPRVANLLNGAWYPVLLPKITKGDYGTVLESELLPAVKRGYERAFTNRKFVNHREGELSEQVTIVDERHKQLIADMEREQIVGIVCYPLQGFSVHAQRQMATLMPENFSLLGAMDAAVADALHPLQLSRGNNTPVRDCSAVQWQESDFSLYFSAADSQLVFDYRYNLGLAAGSFGGGVLLRG